MTTTGSILTMGDSHTYKVIIEDFMGKVYCGVVLINLLSLKKELNLFNKGPRQRGEDKL